MSQHHLDDEQLSAALDGEDEAEAAAHLRSCASCAGRLDALRQTVAAMGAPVAPPTADLVERAVQNAVSHAGRRRREAEPVPLHPRRYLAPSLPWLAAAAAAIALLVGIAALVGTGSDDDFAQTADGGDAERADTGDEATSELEDGGDAFSTGGAGGSFSAGASSDGYEDLGYHDDPDMLAAAVRARVDALEAPAARAPAEQEAHADAPCRTEAESVGGDRLGDLVHVATVQWKQQPAFVLTFVLVERTDPGDGASHQSYVMASSRCSLLAEARL